MFYFCPIGYFVVDQKNGAPAQKWCLRMRVLWYTQMERYSAANPFESDVMKTMGGPIFSQTSHMYRYELDTQGGQSGSGMYAYYPSTGTRVVHAVHAYGFRGATGRNSAVKLTPPKMAGMCSTFPMSDKSVC